MGDGKAKENRQIAHWEELEDLDDMILGGMAAELMKFMCVFGNEKDGVSLLMNGVEHHIRIDERDPKAEPSKRLKQIVDITRKITKKGSKLEHYYKPLTSAALRADGWSLTPYALRSPLWMSTCDEFPREEMRKIEGLEWLEASISL